MSWRFFILVLALIRLSRFTPLFTSRSTMIFIIVRLSQLEIWPYCSHLELKIYHQKSCFVIIQSSVNTFKLRSVFRKVFPLAQFGFSLLLEYWSMFLIFSCTFLSNHIYNALIGELQLSNPGFRMNLGGWFLTFIGPCPTFLMWDFFIVHFIHSLHFSVFIFFASLWTFIFCHVSYSLIIILTVSIYWILFEISNLVKFFSLDRILWSGYQLFLVLICVFVFYWQIILIGTSFLWCSGVEYPFSLFLVQSLNMSRIAFASCSHFFFNMI